MTTTSLPSAASPALGRVATSPGDGAAPIAASGDAGRGAAAGMADLHAAAHDENVERAARALNAACRAAEAPKALPSARLRAQEALVAYRAAERAALDTKETA